MRSSAAGRAARADTEGFGDACDGFRLAFRFDMYDDAGGDRAGKLVDGLAGPGEADVPDRHGRVHRRVHLGRRGDVEPVDQAAQVVNHRRHRVGLDGVVQLDVARQNRPEMGDARIEQSAVVGEERRPADPPGEARQRHAADGQAAVDDAEAIDRRARRLAVRGLGYLGGDRHATATNIWASSSESDLRSILPLGLRCSALRSTTRWGTM